MHFTDRGTISAYYGPGNHQCILRTGEPSVHITDRGTISAYYEPENHQRPKNCQSCYQPTVAFEFPYTNLLFALPGQLYAISAAFITLVPWWYWPSLSLSSSPPPEPPAGRSRVVTVAKVGGRRRTRFERTWRFGGAHLDIGEGRRGKWGGGKIRAGAGVHAPPCVCLQT